jgi:hypothetical protein
MCAIAAAIQLFNGSACALRNPYLRNQHLNKLPAWVIRFDRVSKAILKAPTFFLKEHPDV